MSGCASHYREMDQNLAEIKTVTEASQFIGYPNQKRTMLGHDIYTWTNSVQSMTVMPTFGSVGSINTTAVTSAPTTESCTIELITVKDSLDVDSYQWQGSLQGCNRYAEELFNLHLVHHPAEKQAYEKHLREVQERQKYREN